MGLYLHLTTAEGTRVLKTSSSWFPSIRDGLMELPDGTSIDAHEILSTRLEAKRETPARDAKVQAIEDARAAAYDLRRAIGLPEDPTAEQLEALDSYVGACVTLAEAETALVEHDANLVKAKEAARLKKENPAPAEPKAKVAKTKKAAKK